MFFFSFVVPLTPQSETKNRMSLFPSHYEVRQGPAATESLYQAPVGWAVGMAFFLDLGPGHFRRGAMRERVFFCQVIFGFGPEKFG